MSSNDHDINDEQKSTTEKIIHRYIPLFLFQLPLEHMGSLVL